MATLWTDIHTVETRLSVTHRTVESRLSVRRLTVLENLWKRWKNKIFKPLQWNIYDAKTNTFCHVNMIQTRRSKGVTANRVSTVFTNFTKYHHIRGDAKRKIR